MFLLSLSFFFTSKLKSSVIQSKVEVVDLNNKKTSEMVVSMNVKIGLNCNYPHHYETNQF